MKYSQVNKKLFITIKDYFTIESVFLGLEPLIDQQYNINNKIVKMDLPLDIEDI